MEALNDLFGIKRVAAGENLPAYQQVTSLIPRLKPSGELEKLMPKSELLTWLQSIDPADRARTIWESGLAGLHDADDPELTMLIAASAQYGDEYSRRLAAILPPLPKCTRQRFGRRQRFRRTRPHSPLTKPSPWLTSTTPASVKAVDGTTERSPVEGGSER